MSQSQFFLFMLGLAAALAIPAALLLTPPQQAQADRCAELGGELIGVRAGKPICVRRDALIALP